jgi:hypothetical protein
LDGAGRIAQELSVRQYRPTWASGASEIGASALSLAVCARVGIFGHLSVPVVFGFKTPALWNSQRVAHPQTIAGGALSAASKRKYEPTILDGEPTPIDLPMEIGFSFS